jgi:hypothetical protein
MLLVGWSLPALPANHECRGVRLWLAVVAGMSRTQAPPPPFFLPHSLPQGGRQGTA